MPPPTPIIAAVSPSGSFAGPHNRALTPLLAGSITGSIIGAAWIIGFIIYFYKRHRREKRARAQGYKSHREMLDPPKKQEEFIIPPDPAVVEGKAMPGERIVMERKSHRHSKSRSRSTRRGSNEQVNPVVKHAATLPMSHDEIEEREAMHGRQEQEQEHDQDNHSSSSSSTLLRPAPALHVVSAPSGMKGPSRSREDSIPASPSSLSGQDPSTPLIRPPNAVYHPS